MANTALERLAHARARALRRSVGDQLLELREARELSQHEIARAVDVDRSWLARAEAVEANLTLDALARLASALGAEPSLRLYPATGPRLRDRVQVGLIEALIRAIHPRWSPKLEVPVYHPVRGVIDLVLVDGAAGDLVSAEAHGEIRRAEQQLRWAAQKSDALPSATGWPWMAASPRTSRLLVLRSTRATRDVVGLAPAMFAAAYPGRTRDAIEALTGPAGTPPPTTIVWIDLRGSASRILDGPPRGIAVGR